MIRTLTAREKVLATLVASVLFLFGNFVLIDACWQRSTQLRAELAAKSRQLQMADGMAADAAFWEQRNAWVQASQPPLEDSDGAGVQLLDHVKQLAKKYNVLLESPAIRVPERHPAYVSISIEVETKSAWKPLVEFLHELQRPDRFIALESSNLKIDSTDPTQMRGRFRVARWYGAQGSIPPSL